MYDQCLAFDFASRAGPLWAVAEGHVSREPASAPQEPGSGVVAVVGGRRVAVGTLEWLARQGADVAAARAALEALPHVVASPAAAAGLLGSPGSPPAGDVGSLSAGARGVGASNSRVFVAVEGVVAGAVDVADAVREDARDTIARLQAQVRRGGEAGPGRGGCRSAGLARAAAHRAVWGRLRGCWGCPGA